MRRFLPLLVLLLMIFPLSASELRVGIYRAVPDFLYTYVGDVVALSFSRRVSSPLLDQVNYSREEREFLDKKESEMHQAISKEKTYTDKGDFEYTNWYGKDVTFVQIERSDEMDAFLDERNMSALEYLALSNRLDLIVYFSLKGESMILTKDMYIYIDGRTIDGPEGLVLRRDPYSRFDADISFLLENLFPTLSILDLAKVPKPYTAYCDRERLFVINDRAVVEAGIRSIRVVPHNFVERTIYIDVVGNERFSFDALFMEETKYPLTIGSVPYGANVTLLGNNGSAPLYFDTVPNPTIFSVSENGFKASVIQLMSSDRLYVSHLRPEWAGNDGEVKKAKRRVYKSIRNTLLALGANAIMRASANIWPERENELRPYNDITLGLGLIGVVSIFHNCYNYYYTAKDTYHQE